MAVQRKLVLFIVFFTLTDVGQIVNVVLDKDIIILRLRFIAVKWIIGGSV